MLRKELERLQDGLTITECPELGPAVHWKPAANLPFHRWFRYREAFSPALFTRFSDAKVRLDPFCGCGTTLLTSAHEGVQAYGIDVNPLSTFVTMVKSAKYSKRDAGRLVGDCTAAIEGIDSTEPATMPDYPLLGKLFLPESIETLLRLRGYINALPAGGRRNLAQLAWLSILERCSNAFKEGNGLKYRNKRRKPGRYVTIPDREWIPRYFGGDVRGFVLDQWKTQCAAMADDIAGADYSRYLAPSVRTGTCLDPAALDFGVEFDLAVFSPPYANRFDYFEAFKIELWLGSFVTNQAEMLDLRSSGMRSNLAATKYVPQEVWTPLKPFLDAMDPEASSVRMGIAGALEGYFHDTRTLLRGLRGVLTAEGRVAMVVGNSAYAKSIIATDALVARIAEEEGYTVSEIQVARHLHVSSQQRVGLGHLEEFMRESVVVLEKQA